MSRRILKKLKARKAKIKYIMKNEAMLKRPSGVASAGITIVEAVINAVTIRKARLSNESRQNGYILWQAPQTRKRTI